MDFSAGSYFCFVVYFGDVFYCLDLPAWLWFTCWIGLLFYCLFMKLCFLCWDCWLRCLLLGVYNACLYTCCWVLVHVVCFWVTVVCCVLMCFWFDVVFYVRFGFVIGFDVCLLTNCLYVWGSGEFGLDLLLQVVFLGVAWLGDWLQLLVALFTMWFVCYLSCFRFVVLCWCLLISLLLWFRCWYLLVCCLFFMYC